MRLPTSDSTLATCWRGPAGTYLRAARYRGEPGPVPYDIDVLVVGTADRDNLDEIAGAAQERLQRPVSIRRVIPAAWEAQKPEDPFLASLQQRPLVEIPIDGHEGEDA